MRIRAARKRNRRTRWANLKPAVCCGAAIELKASSTSPVAASFDAAIVRQAIGEAQTLAPGYTYKGFCAKVAGAGCAGYLVSFVGKRVLYYGRTGEIHTEYFPGAQPAAKP